MHSDEVPPPLLRRDGWPWQPVSAARVRPAPPPRWPRISIVTPALDQGEFLEEAVHLLAALRSDALGTGLEALRWA